MRCGEPDFSRIRHPHLVGAGGAGMSGLATILAAAGHRVTGSDLVAGENVRHLRASGVSVALGHASEQVPGDCDLLVVSAAIREENPEVAEARRRGLPVVKYAAALGALMGSRRGIAVAGAHGKTTTTGLVAFTLCRLGADPSFVVGGRVGPLGGSSRVGKGPLLVAEACEFDRSFHELRPEMAVITNIDEDHLDYYSGIAEITEAFRTFGRLLPPDGYLVTLNEVADALGAGAGIACSVETVGLAGYADWVAKDVEVGRKTTRFTVARNGQDVVRVALSLPGHHNVLNATMALALCARLGHDPQVVARTLHEFRGVSRRLEVKFNRGGIVVVDDYAHHPAEIRASLKAIRATWPGTRVWCVFQPHQATRTRFLLREFATALAEADRVIVPEIFFARDTEEEKRRISSLDLVKRTLNLGADVVYREDFEEIVNDLLTGLRPRDVLVTMGAGDIHRVADAVVARLERYGNASIPA